MNGSQNGWHGHCKPRSSLYTNVYIKTMKTPTAQPIGKQTDKPRKDQSSIDWKTNLPAEWQGTVEVPLYFRHFSEYEINAQRCLGYDADDRPCFIAHSYELTRLTTDDDEEFYESVTYSENMAAWRLRDERWLVFRKIGTGSGIQQRGFYALSPDMPR